LPEAPPTQNWACAAAGSAREPISADVTKSVFRQIFTERRSKF
jgi:hypothetical protein